MNEDEDEYTADVEEVAKDTGADADDLLNIYDDMSVLNEEYLLDHDDEEENDLDIDEEKPEGFCGHTVLNNYCFPDWD